jgi:hypothetical protein
MNNIVLLRPTKRKAGQMPEDFKTGEQLLSEWECKTREAKLERAVLALMEQLNSLHAEHKASDLESDNSLTCSCADAYRMGKEALKTAP